MVVRRRRAPPRPIREPIGTRWPEQGSVVVGTEGMLVLPHGNTPPFALPEAKNAALPSRSPDRDHYGEFIDVVLAAARTSARRARLSGPLTESVLIGNGRRVSRRDARVRRQGAVVPEKKDANQYLTRDYRTAGRSRPEPLHSQRTTPNSQ